MGSHLPLELRIRLHDEVLQLREQGLSYNIIIERIRRLTGVRLNPSHVSFWTRRLHQPMGGANRFAAKPSSSLAYVIGVKTSDGYLYKHGYNHLFGLGVVDREFAAETGRCLANLMEHEKPFLPWWDKYNGRWCVRCHSVLLYGFLQQTLEKLRPYIEHCEDCVAAFLRAFFDGEGSIIERDLRVTNNKKELLVYIQQLLWQYFGIETTGPYPIGRAPGQLYSAANGRIYRTKNQCYYIRIRVQSLPTFHRSISFTIARKQRRLLWTVQ